MPKFKLKADFQPTGDQPQAIEALVKGLNSGKKHQTLLGVTGSGKTYTIANVIAAVQKPTLVISHNKTLAAQLYQEFRDFFPENAVSYFVSYYDYYQPEAYIPKTDTYIEKETNINDEIDKLRLSATANLLTRSDVIVVASVSCIYNLGSPVEYGRYILELIEGQLIDKQTVLARLTDLQYQRNDYELKRGVWQLKGETLLIYPAYVDYCLKLVLLDNQIESIRRVDPVSLEPIADTRPAPKREVIYPAKHYLTNPITQKQALKQIRRDLARRLEEFKSKNKLVEAFRLEQKVNYDLEMIESLGFVNGIENYSRYFDGRLPGEPSFSLLEYFPKDYLTVIDESHMSLPQIRGMYRGDQSRKQTLIDYGFRLPAAIDNRPLKFLEFLSKVPQAIYVSATPDEWELSQSGRPVEQLVRPTGISDPKITLRPSTGQIQDLIKEIKLRVSRKERVLVTALTKKNSEALAEHLQGENLKVEYLHSDVKTLDRSDILDKLRLGDFDVLVGINLLREGLDLPEVSLVAILDADKEGFLRSQTSLIQTMGRAARHVDGQVIMYADKLTGSMDRAIKEVSRRRQIQLSYNRTHHLNPKSIVKPIRRRLLKKTDQAETDPLDPNSLTYDDRIKYQLRIKRQMLRAAQELNFDKAAKLKKVYERFN
ncbi:excinuclease ABC subunit B [Candidatus Beckwithbacteria bacterium CG22_combo_CG10-13_8_21_14_all_01_47_9]|uniref:Excinuclease ABC subunit B n=5 Tax=Candidatus Beckwithiibacteriota TaxID=1752726 RepID=A0A2H0E0F1_9BACT|nr:MAG: excinuclease ABC subunit B [Candidatus Beckwithbacteria bacterium CG1_02_47_37]PIP52274.1 MAG: excinuclease ABC subunit B [Candidatus Beckwithbacteria bacterium CG23_combo_of_CG06-09_8_20_14_all_47_9]PIP87903.1 MAG: excinuclease ABC subunit B [Candidatus Beckwithbacteria bacterium CG22_combo_CG10-13_8_21_14_all_01_47_9]PJA23225.1 MAG: excinuclease ABC subunit B [Candidatus Beckwithbacteria bacterium CG_4_10_14_0_2_um_filter_47_25]PJC66461.1 MAG: excinuclease ABC subunit B [Candidatus Be